MRARTRRRFPHGTGNPYDHRSAPYRRGWYLDGTSIDWGVYGVPETFIVDAKGVIRFKHVGPLTMDDDLADRR